MIQGLIVPQPPKPILDLPFDPPPSTKFNPKEVALLRFVNLQGGLAYSLWPPEFRLPRVLDAMCHRLGWLRRKNCPTRYYVTRSGFCQALWIEDLVRCRVEQSPPKHTSSAKA